MSWDDEDFEVPDPLAPQKAKWAEEDAAATKKSWEDEDVSDSEEEQQVVSPPPPAAPKEKTKLELAIERKEAAERAYREQLAQQLKKEEANLATKNISDAKVAEKLRLQKMQEVSDLLNAEDMFGGLAIKPTPAEAAPAPAPAEPAKKEMTAEAKAAKAEDGIAVSVEQMAPKTEAEFAQLAQSLAAIIHKHSKSKHYILLLKTLTQKMLDGLKSDDVKEVERAATVVYNEALKKERVQVKGKKKATTAPKKAAVRVDKGYGGDDYDDMDFM